MRTRAAQPALFCKTPIGVIEIRGSERAVASARLVRAAGRAQGAPRALRDFSAELRRYFGGSPARFRAALHPKGTRFQKRVWKELSKIPFGRTASYREVARRIGHPRAARAVGLAASRNPILVAIPCHRMIAQSGKLSGFACGVRRKAWLLSHERR